MPIAFDTSDQTSGAGATLTRAYTITGINPCLWVGIADPDSTLTGVTYNGAAMSNINNFAFGAVKFTLFVLNAPATGTHNIVATRSGSGSTFVLTAASYNGALQTGQPDSSNTGTDSGLSNLTVSTTVVNTGCWLIGFGGAEALTGAPGFISDKTDRQTGEFTGGNSHAYTLFDTNGAVGTGSQSATCTLTLGGVSPKIGMILASMAPISNPIDTSLFFSIT